MNQIFLGSFALIFAAILWGFGRKPQKAIQSFSKKEFLGPIPQENLSLVKKLEKNNSSFLKSNESNFFQSPTNQTEKIFLRKKLFKLIKGNPEERLYAVKVSSQWGHSAVISILTRGLKDSDSRIVIEAAQGIQKYKKVPMTTNHPLKRPPRNVFLMRYIGRP